MDGGLHRLFETRAGQAPDRPALVAGPAVVSYGELDGRANRLARHLLASGHTAGDTVAVLAGRAPDLVVAMLAALKAGAAYTVIGPDEPMDEIERLLAAADARVVVTDRELRPLADDGSGRPAVCVDTEAEADRVSVLGRPFPGCRAEIRRGDIRLVPPDGGDAIGTGDRGRLREDGLLEFRGRRAHRFTADRRTVHPYEAEAVLAAHPAIREAAIARLDGGGLAAYVVPAAGTAPGAAEVRAQLSGEVPDRLIPDVVLPLDSLPRNRAGKVDRRALPQPVSSPGSARAGAKGAGASNAYLAYLRRTDRLVSAVVLAPIAALAAVLLTGVLWPGSTDLRAVPQPWAGLFTGLYVAEWLAFGLGVAFLVFGRGLMPSRGRSPVLTTAAHLAIGWLLVAWWPQDNLYRLAAKDDWPQQAALVYGFNVTLIVAALIVAIHATRPATPSS